MNTTQDNLNAALGLIARATAALMPGVPQPAGSDKLFEELALFHRRVYGELKAEAKKDAEADYAKRVAVLDATIEERFSTAKAKFVRGFEENATTHTMKWQSEELMRLEEMHVLMRHASARVQAAVKSVAPEIASLAAKIAVMEYIQWLTLAVIRNPPKHYSTSAVENLLNLCTNESKCQTIIGLHELIGQPIA